ncbi:MAG: DRTGG domain-containing protein [Dehalococcoidia bacterium]
MVALYIASLEEAAGRTALCLGIAQRLLETGKRVGFLKPVLVDHEPPASGAGDEDTVFLKKALNLKGPDGAPLSLTLKELEKALAGEDKGFDKKLKDALSSASSGKDVVILEGLSGQVQASAEIARRLGAKSLLVARYKRGLAEELAIATQKFDSALLGVVINAVPANRMEAASALATGGIKLLGIIPQDRRLLAMTVGELAQYLGGQILNGDGGLDELVENLMVGALCLDPAPLYLNRRANKAVITRSGRSDVQLAALETPTRCLVLTGDTDQPNLQVMIQAEEKGVPIIQVEPDTLDILTSLEGALSQVRFRQEKKMGRLQELMHEHFDFEALSRGLGLAS